MDENLDFFYFTFGAARWSDSPLVRSTGMLTCNRIGLGWIGSGGVESKQMGLSWVMLGWVESDHSVRVYAHTYMHTYVNISYTTTLTRVLHFYF